MIFIKQIFFFPFMILCFPAIWDKGKMCLFFVYSVQSCISFVELFISTQSNSTIQSLALYNTATGAGTLSEWSHPPSTLCTVCSYKQSQGYLCSLSVTPESQPFQRVSITTVADGSLVSYVKFNSISHFMSLAFLFKDFVRSQLVRHRHGNQNHKGRISKNIERLRFLSHKYGAFLIKRTHFVFFQHSI